MKLPSYLRLSRHNVFKFRRRVPDDLAAQFVGSELRVSLGTRHRAEAACRSRAIASELDVLFGRLRVCPSSPKYWTPSRVMTLLRARLMSFELASAPGQLPRLQLVSEAGKRVAGTLKELLAELRQKGAALYIDATGWDVWAVDDISQVDREGGRFVANSYELLGEQRRWSGFVQPYGREEAWAGLITAGEFSESVFRVGISAGLFLGVDVGKTFPVNLVYAPEGAVEAAAELLRGRSHLEGIGPADALLEVVASTPVQLPVAMPKVPVVTGSTEPPAPSLSEVIETRFFTLPEIARLADKPATVRKDRDALTLFKELVGDKPINLVTQADAKRFSVEISRFKAKGERAPSTCNGHMSSVSKFNEWVRGHYSEYGMPALDFRTLRHVSKIKLRPDERRDEFTKAELQRLFHHPMIETFARENLPKFWLLHIGLYTGMRVEEICQLHPRADFQNISGCDVIKIQEGEGQSLKNRNAKRTIPIHPQLIELGLIDYVEALREAGATRLFPHTTAYEGRVGKNLAKTVNRFIQEKVGLDGKSNHCFRHTLNNHFKQNQVLEGLAAAITGHGYGGITYNVYGKAYEPSLLFDVIKKVDFGLRHVRPVGYMPPI